MRDDHDWASLAREASSIAKLKTTDGRSARQWYESGQNCQINARWCAPHLAAGSTIHGQRQILGRDVSNRQVAEHRAVLVGGFQLVPADDAVGCP